VVIISFCNSDRNWNKIEVSYLSNIEYRREEIKMKDMNWTHIFICFLTFGYGFDSVESSFSNSNVVSSSCRRLPLAFALSPGATKMRQQKSSQLLRRKDGNGAGFHLSASCSFQIGITGIQKQKQKQRRSHKTKLFSDNSSSSSWEHGECIAKNPYYFSPLIMKTDHLHEKLIQSLVDSHKDEEGKNEVENIRKSIIIKDPLWEQILIEGQYIIEQQPSAGPQIYTHILSQPSLIQAITSIVSHEISTQLIPAVSLQNLFLEMLVPEEDFPAIALDIVASAMMSPSFTEDDKALNSVLFNQGLHALVCHRLAHRLWKADRTGLAVYIQSTVSRQYSTDIHPAATFGKAIYLNAGSAGVVIGETAVIDDDVIILQGVTLGGTGKERGDRHPKVKTGAILQQSCSVLGNIEVGEGAVVTAKSIVTKPVLPHHRVSGVPARDKGEVKRFQQQENDDSAGCVRDESYDEKIEWRSDAISSGRREDLENILKTSFDLMWKNSGSP